MTDTKGQGRFSQVPAEAVLDKDLTETDFRVLSIIGLYLNRDKEAWPMQSTIADQLGKSSTTVNRAIKRLEAKGYIRSRKKYEHQPGTHRVYQVVFEQPGIGKNDHSGISSKGRTSHKNNPIEQPNNNNVSFLKFEQAYKLYNSTDNKVNQVKATAKTAWQKAVKKTDPEIILSAIQAEVDARSNSEQWIPALPQMQRWLKEERWESIETTTKPETPENAPRNTGEQTESGQAIYELNGERFYFGASGPIKIKEAHHARSNRERDPAMGEVQTSGRAQANLSFM